MEAFQQRISLVLILVKQTQNHAWVCIIMLITVICLLMETKSLSWKPATKAWTFTTQFCFGNIPNDFRATESKEVYLNENVYHFSVGYNSIDKSDILNIHKYLMTKNNRK